MLARIGARDAAPAGAPKTPWHGGRLPQVARRKYLGNQSLVATGAACHTLPKVGRLAGRLTPLPTPPEGRRWGVGSFVATPRCRADGRGAGLPHQLRHQV